MRIISAVAAVLVLIGTAAADDWRASGKKLGVSLGRPIPLGAANVSQPTPPARISPPTPIIRGKLDLKWAQDHLPEMDYSSSSAELELDAVIPAGTSEPARAQPSVSRPVKISTYNTATDNATMPYADESPAPRTVIENEVIPVAPRKELSPRSEFSNRTEFAAPNIQGYIVHPGGASTCTNHCQPCCCCSCCHCGPLCRLLSNIRYRCWCLSQWLCAPRCCCGGCVNGCY